MASDPASRVLPLLRFRGRPDRAAGRRDRRAWHAGKSLLGRRDDINSRSIGIELVNPGHEFGYRSFPPPQIDALIALCRTSLSATRFAGAGARPFRRGADPQAGPGRIVPLARA